MNFTSCLLVVLAVVVHTSSAALMTLDQQAVLERESAMEKERDVTMVAANVDSGSLRSRIKEQRASKQMTTARSSYSTELSGGNDSAKRTLQACIGECDADAQCAAGLKCFQRSNGEEIPGCHGPGHAKDWDYCYDPTTLSGGNDNSAKGTLQACTGECDADVQCAAGLKCFQRSNGEEIPGCYGSGKAKDWDYCYDPTTLSGSNDNGILRRRGGGEWGKMAADGIKDILAAIDFMTSQRFDPKMMLDAPPNCNYICSGCGWGGCSGCRCSIAAGLIQVVDENTTPGVYSGKRETPFLRDCRILAEIAEKANVLKRCMDHGVSTSCKTTMNNALKFFGKIHTDPKYDVAKQEACYKCYNNEVSQDCDADMAASMSGCKSTNSNLLKNCFFHEGHGLDPEWPYNGGLLEQRAGEGGRNNASSFMQSTRSKA